ncbi:MAG: ABC transporter ATP-binding protein [Ignavibacteriae bacterium]|nr:MAG: ABC transporter ATP-binding protein [Ignavibacteriota bacterium]
MNLLSVENLSKTYGTKVLFKEISFGLDKGQKAALIARNGTGKSTLLKILSRLEHADEGNITYRNDIKVEYLPQDPILNEELNVIETILDSNKPIAKAVKYYEECLANPDDKISLNKAIELMELMKAWDYDSKMKQVLYKLNITQLDAKISTLSGGQKKRVSMAKVLIEEPDLIYLDEPTNHLDLDMIEWLEDYLLKQSITLLMVTHDRYFLERVCNEIIEMENGTLYKYNGNYSYYMEKKAFRLESEEKNIEKMQSIYRNELEWIKRGPKARGTKAKSRIDKFNLLEEKLTGVTKESGMEFKTASKRLGGKIIELHNLYKQFGDIKIIENLSYKFRKFERLGIVGRNGTGKTTLLNLMTGYMEPDDGRIETGKTVEIGYFKQDGLIVKENKRLIDVIKEIAEVIMLGNGRTVTASQFLEMFLFPSNMHFTPVSKLSGGERRRLYLVTVLMKNPNFLILDEPTNDLDIITLNVLEEYLDNFKGCLVVVTHDRYFMDKLVDHLFIFEGDGKIKDFNGNYIEYREEQKITESELARELNSQREVIPKPAKPKTRLSYNEKREYEKLEIEILELERRKNEINEIMNSGLTDYLKLNELSKELVKTMQLIDEKTHRWLELSEYE